MGKNASSLESAKQLRRERDRFLAFAFCRADLLLELDRNRKIVFASGACRSLFDRQAEELQGRDLLDLISPQDHPVVTETLAGMLGGDRPEPIDVSCRNKSGPDCNLSLTGYFVKDLQSHFFLSGKIPTMTRASSADEKREAGGAILHDVKSFSEVVGERLKSSGDHKLTLLEMENYPAVLDQLDATSQMELHDTINSYLRASSDEANSAAAFGQGRFGLIHRPGLDLDHLSSELSAQVRTVDPSGLGVQIEKASVVLAEAGVAGGNPEQAFDYMVRQFARGGENGLKLNELREGLPEVLAKIQKTATEVRSVIADESFKMAFQPIVELKTRDIHHYEVLARIDGEIGSPERFIKSAEDLSLIRGFDMAVCRKAIQWLSTETARPSPSSIAVNLSAQSIGDTAFVNTLKSELETLGGKRKHLLFEITESSRMENPAGANEAIQDLRKAGHKVCLDDFGVGEASLQYLRQFQVDILKIDGSYVRECLQDKTSAHILKAIADLCSDLEIETVAEMVEDIETAQFLINCGITFGQGYFYGRPSQDIAVFQDTKKSRPIARRRGETETWA